MADISTMLFNHIENKNRFPIEKLKLMILQYDKQLKDKENAENQRIEKYKEEYESKRIVANEKYANFLQERSVLYKRWKEEKSKESALELAKLKFTMDEVPELYTYYKFQKDPIVFSQQPNPVKPRKSSKPKNAEKVLKKCPEGQISKRGKCTKTAFWNLQDIEEKYKENVDYWENHKTKVCDYDGVDVNFPTMLDYEDIESLLENNWITSAVINVYLKFILEKSQKSDDYVLLNSELYYDLVNVLEKNEDLSGMLEGYLTNIPENIENKKIILPINLNNTHWIFGMYHPEEKQILIIDPYGTPNKEVFENLKLLWKTISNTSNIKYKAVYKIPRITKQPLDDTTSCGIFVCMYFEYLIRNGKFPSSRDVSERDIPYIRKYILNIITYEICQKNSGSKSGGRFHHINDLLPIEM